MTATSRMRFETAAGLVVQDCAPVGPAGGAWLHPEPDVELIFDRVSGELCYLAISGGTPGGSWSLSEQAAAFLDRLCGRLAADLVSQVASGHRSVPGLLADAGLSRALSALARLRAARATSPVPASPWWDAQEAQLARAAGLPELASAAARAAVRALAGLKPGQLSERQVSAALIAADIAATAMPAAAASVRRLAKAAIHRRASECPNAGPDHADRGVRAGPDLAGDGLSPGPDDAGAWSAEQGSSSDLEGTSLGQVLDLTRTPPGLFLPALSPDNDLLVQQEAGSDGRITVAVRLAPGADRRSLRPCRARLVVAAQATSAGQVLADSSLTGSDPHAVAELRPPPRAGELTGGWIEIVRDELVPVHTEKHYRIKSALRWADAALRAGQRPRGLAPRFTAADWLALAATAWQHCRDDWQAAGDSGQAASAAGELAAVVARSPAPASVAEPGDQAEGQELASIAEESGE
jgi:hypothetical protein